MARFSSKTVNLPVSADVICEKFSDLSRFESALEQLPDEQRAKIGDVKFDSDTLIIQTPQVGEIKFQRTELTPEKIAFAAIGSPVPLNMIIDLKALSSDSTDLTTNIEVEIPAMLRPLLGGTMQKAADQFSQLIAKLANQ